MLASLIRTQSIIVYHCMSWRSNKGFINLLNQGQAYFSVVKSVQTLRQIKKIHDSIADDHDVNICVIFS